MHYDNEPTGPINIRDHSANNDGRAGGGGAFHLAKVSLFNVRSKTLSRIPLFRWIVPFTFANSGDREIRLRGIQLRSFPIRRSFVYVTYLTDLRAGDYKQKLRSTIIDRIINYTVALERTGTDGKNISAQVNL